MPNPITYSIPVKIFFWLFWIIGIGVILIFGLFAFISAGGSDPFFPKGWGIVLWDSLVAGVCAFLLFKTAWHFFKADREGSNLLLWVAIAALVVPLVGFGGCLMPEMLRNV